MFFIWNYKGHFVDFMCTLQVSIMSCNSQVNYRIYQKDSHRGIWASKSGKTPPSVAEVLPDVTPT